MLNAFLLPRDLKSKHFEFEFESEFESESGKRRL